MAQKLETYNWGDRHSPSRLYDWPNWLNGHIWQIRSGEDYNVSTQSMRTALHEKAKSQGRKVRTSKVPHRDKPDYGQWEGLVFQYYQEEE